MKSFLNILKNLINGINNTELFMLIKKKHSEMFKKKHNNRINLLRRLNANLSYASMQYLEELLLFEKNISLEKQDILKYLRDLADGHYIKREYFQSIKYYNLMIDIIIKPDNTRDDFYCVGEIYNQISGCYYEMDNYLDGIDCIIKAKYYYDKYSNVKDELLEFKIACYKILSDQHLEASFYLENIISKNNQFTYNAFMKNYIFMLLLCYFCTIPNNNLDYNSPNLSTYIYMNNIRQKIAGLKRHMPSFCEHNEYLLILNILSCFETKDLNRYTIEVYEFNNINNNHCKNDSLQPLINTLYSKLFIDIKKKLGIVVGLAQDL